MVSFGFCRVDMIDLLVKQVAPASAEDFWPNPCIPDVLPTTDIKALPACHTAPFFSGDRLFVGGSSRAKIQDLLQEACLAMRLWHASACSSARSLCSHEALLMSQGVPG